VRDEADLRNVAARIRRAFEQPLHVADTMVAMSVSAGIAVFPQDGVTQEDLFTHAGAALSHARALGRGNFEFYERQLTEQARQRVRIEADLRHVVERGELVLFYQPKVLLHSGKPVGAEALMRWRRPGLGLVPPDQFIPIAEQTGAIAEMGAWALREACGAVARWNAGRAEPLTIAVNLSARQFEGGGFSQIVRHALASTGCLAEWVELEITESLLLTDQPTVLEQLSVLHDMGIRIAIDDFGTGYSALSYLTRFPIDTLKIDRSFVKALGNGTENAVLVRTIVGLAQNLNLEVVAEGVESHEQGQMLRSWNCSMAQGYLYGKPMPEDEFTAMLAGLETGMPPV
jgi:EAL domain-containing protein (putative c-di-GMP-specific phosphodiesterase class I)